MPLHEWTRSYEDEDMEKTRLAIICDFDGTITKLDVGHQIYMRFGDERWEEINKRWRRGQISSKDCLIGEYKLIDASEQEVRQHILKTAGDIDLPYTDTETRALTNRLAGPLDPCREITSSLCRGGPACPPFRKNDTKLEKPKSKKKDTIKKLKMKKRVGDMDDGRYIVYYDF